MSENKPTHPDEIRKFVEETQEVCDKAAPGKFRKIALVDAVQYTGQSGIPGVCTGECLRKGTHFNGFDDFPPHIHTLEGMSHSLYVGDWVVKGIRGERWRVEESIFAETYEPAIGADARTALPRALQIIREQAEEIQKLKGTTNG